MAKSIVFGADLQKYLKKNGFHQIFAVPVKYKDGISTVQYEWYPNEISSEKDITPETPYIQFEIDDETDGFVFGQFAENGLSEKETEFDKWSDLDAFFKMIDN